MKTKWCFTFAMYLMAVLVIGASGVYAKSPVYVVTTFSDYASIVKEIGGDKVVVEYLSQGDQDPHFVAPKPSLALKLKKADMFVTTGMDLEVWASTLLDKARNDKIMDGAVGFVTVYTGLDILEKPTTISRTEGDIHVYGNPHIHTSPMNWIKISDNICMGLKKVDPENADYYDKRQKAFVDKIDRSMFGDKLVELIGGDHLSDLLLAGTLFEFLDKEYQGEKLINSLGGWLKQAMPFRNKEVVAYHKNWAYFARDFGLNIIGFIEVKPGIPPSPKDVQTTINLIKEHGVDVMLVASYFEKRKPTTIAQKTGIQALFLPLSVDAIPEVSDNFKLVSYWIDSINKAVQGKSGGIISTQ
ncbi:metal ABC transporter substrate-binding protein [bacterium]|nr:metal ABC transporter substrate-binding protein [bacterium]